MTRRMDILRRELRSTVLQAAPGLRECVWEPFQGPRREKPYASWRPITQPSGGPRITDDTGAFEIPTTINVRVLNVTPGEGYKLYWNYTQATSPVDGASTLTSIRDDLIAKINSDRDPVTATAIAADTLQMVGNTTADLWQVLSSGEFLECEPAPGSPTEVIYLQRAPLKMTASLNVFSSGTSAEGGSLPPDSSSYAHEIDVAFKDPMIVERLNDFNISITRMADPVNLDGTNPAQDQYESRTATDYMIELMYWRSRPADYIERVEATISTDKGTSTFTVG